MKSLSYLVIYLSLTLTNFAISQIENINPFTEPIELKYTLYHEGKWNKYENNPPEGTKIKLIYKNENWWYAEIESKPVNNDNVSYIQKILWNGKETKELMIPLTSNDKFITTLNVENEEKKFVFDINPLLIVYSPLKNVSTIKSEKESSGYESIFLNELNTRSKKYTNVVLNKSKSIPKEPVTKIDYFRDGTHLESIEFIDFTLNYNGFMFPEQVLITRPNKSEESNRKYIAIQINSLNNVDNFKEINYHIEPAEGTYIKQSFAGNQLSADELNN